MVYVRGARAVATAALLLAVGGCVGDGNDPAASGSPTPSLPSTTSASSSTPTPPSDSEIASEAAADVVRHYYALRDGLRRNPRKPLLQLNRVAIGAELRADRRLFAQERSRHLRQVGDTSITKLTVQSVNLDNSNPSQGRVPTAQVDVCWDVSHADLVDKSGKSVVSSRRADRGSTRFTVANYHWASDPHGGWRVVTGQDLKQSTCASS
jgi:hypothetical protein